MSIFGSSYDDDEGSMFGSMFGPKMGSWWVTSKADPRWNKTGRGYGLVTTGGPGEMQTWIDECKAKYGTPPLDCECGFMKD